MIKIFRVLPVLAIIAFLQLSEAQQAPQQSETNQEAAPEATAQSARFRSCFRSCQTITNYNPVCGSDGVTYDNQQRLQCAQRCGQNVQSVRGGSCAPVT